MIAARILKEIRARLGFLQSVGLEYLDAFPQQRARCPAAKASASGWPPRSVLP